MKEIKITEIENIRIGSAENKEAGTGCTVIICERGAAAGLDVRGGGPASRESELLKPMAAADMIQAVLLSGGSAFGLDAAGGVMEYLEERGIGFDVGITKVPLVCESCLFDLMVGDFKTRPDKAMGYAACEGAEKNNYQDGNFGAGTGASVGKLGDKSLCMKGGIGSYAVQIGDLKVGAIVAVNARGDIYDWKDGKKVAGLLNADRKTFADTEEAYIPAPLPRKPGHWSHPGQPRPETRWVRIPCWCPPFGWRLWRPRYPRPSRPCPYRRRFPRG